MELNNSISNIKNHLINLKMQNEIELKKIETRYIFFVGMMKYQFRLH